MEAAFPEDEMSTTLRVEYQVVLSAEIIRKLRDAEADRNLFK